MKRLKLAIAAVVMAGLASGLALSPVAGTPDAPPQPVAFDHFQHVTKEDGPGLACAICHEHADKSAHATIPNISTCMICHESIKTDSPEVQKLAQYAERGEQPPWQRVYWIGESARVFFTHKPHIRAGVECADCHGDVAQMRVVRREVELTMAWCIECHRRRQASIDCYICHR